LTPQLFISFTYVC